MELTVFTTALGRLSAEDLHALATTLSSHGSAADEVDAWHATLTIDRALRRAHRARVAAHAATNASHAVLTVAAHHQIALPDDEVTHVARAAAEIARGLVAGPDAADEVESLLKPWVSVLGVAA